MAADVYHKYRNLDRHDLTSGFDFGLALVILDDPFFEGELSYKFDPPRSFAA